MKPMRNRGYRRGRGHAVALVNFSSETRYLRPTRNVEALYRVMSQVQAQGTQLPRLSALPARWPHDLVLVTDTAIHNLDGALRPVTP